MADEPRFVVLRSNWRWTSTGWILLPGETIVASFGLRGDAEEFAIERDATARIQIGNPFRLGPLDELTHMPTAVFRDWVQDVDTQPPTGDDWARWWDENEPKWTHEQVRHVAEGLTRVRFHRVEERPAKRVAYVVIGVLWEYNDEWYEPGVEGGQPMRGFRRRADAEAYCELLTNTARYIPLQCDITRWVFPDPLATVLGSPGEAIIVDQEDDQKRGPLYEVCEIELGDGTDG